MPVAVIAVTSTLHYAADHRQSAASRSASWSITRSRIRWDGGSRAWAAARSAPARAGPRGEGLAEVAVIRVGRPSGLGRDGDKSQAGRLSDGRTRRCRRGLAGSMTSS